MPQINIDTTDPFFVVDRLAQVSGNTFQALGIIKATSPKPGWNPAPRKCWTIMSSQVDDLASRLIAGGFTVTLNGEPYTEEQRQAFRRAEQERDAQERAEQEARERERQAKAARERAERERRDREHAERRRAFEEEARRQQQYHYQSFRYPPPSTGAAGAETDLTRWAEVMLRQYTPEARKRLVRRLTKVLHPDVGGDAELMMQLNEARRLLKS